MTPEVFSHHRVDSFQVNGGCEYDYEKTPLESNLQALNSESWKIISSILRPSPRRLTLQAKINDWNFINIIIEPSKTGRLTFGDRLLDLVSQTHEGSSDPSVESLVTDYTNVIRLHCQWRWGTEKAPPFLYSIHVLPASGLVDFKLVEKIDLDLLQVLQPLNAILDACLLRDLPPNIPVCLLKPKVRKGCFFLPNTRMVQFEGAEYVAKGPIYPSRVPFDMAELIRLLELPEPRSPYVVPRPSALITLSETDHRIGGFLMPFYANGNLDIFAKNLRERGELTTRLLLLWFRQMVDALQYLSSHGLWHGDLKPDNMLVDKEGNIALTDFAQTFATCATASPEVRAQMHSFERQTSEVNVDDTDMEKETEVMGIPASWEHSRIIQSEIYSLGRTMYLICEGTSMMDIYRTVGWVNVKAAFPTTFDLESKTPQCLRSLIVGCVEHDPLKRIGLDKLAEEIEKYIEQQ